MVGPPLHLVMTREQSLMAGISTGWTAGCRPALRAVTYMVVVVGRNQALTAAPDTSVP